MSRHQNISAVVKQLFGRVFDFGIGGHADDPQAQQARWWAGKRCMAKQSWCEIWCHVMSCVCCFDIVPVCHCKSSCVGNKTSECM